MDGFIQTTPHSIADIAGANSTVQIQAAAQNAQWVQFGNLPVSSDNIRWGGPTTDATHGMFMAPGGAQFLSSANVNMAEIYLYIPTGCTVTVTWGN